MQSLPPITPIVLVLKLADTSKAPQAAKVSKLPLPISDSPLVIDLPDGQKIVVGKMTQGSVIEVATWRGVGRPDSRTSRLMLGMGSGNVNEEAEQQFAGQSPQQAPQKAKPKGIAGFIAVATDIIKNWNKINWKATFQALIQSKKKSKKARPQVDAAPAAADTNIAPAITVHPVSEDSEIEEWLNKISAQASKTSARATTKKATTAKKATTTKKAAPKTSNSRSNRK